MTYCLIPSIAEDFKKKLSSGEIDPEKLNKMTSAERNAFFADIAGEHNASKINSLFESKIILKNKELGYINWAKQLTGIKEEVRRDLIKKIQNMIGDAENGKFILNPKNEEAFLHDLASTRLGTDVSFEEAKTITELSNKLTESKGKLNPDGYTFKTAKEKFEYGASKVLLEKYVAELKLSNKPGRGWNIAGRLFDLAGVSKSLRATLDNSFIGRQGIKVLSTNPKIWIKNALKSFRIIGKTLVQRKGAIDQTDAVLADVYSRSNALNKETKTVYKYLDLGNAEEAYPTSWPEKIPLMGRLFKASEQSYTGTAYMMRADLADFYIPKAIKQGVDLTDDVQAKSLAKLINAMTGRGTLGKGENIASGLNVAFFSIKFAKSNFDTLTAHAAQRGVSRFVRKEAAKNLLKIVAGTSTVLAIADKLHPGSVEWDPRSSDFGKIRIGDTRFDVSGGMASMITLVARVAKQSTKSTSTGQITKLGTKFGQKSGSDVAFDFFAGKLSPASSFLKHLFIDRAGYMGEPLTVKGELTNLFVPMPITTFQELRLNPNSANNLLAIIADGLGISTNTYQSNVKSLKTLNDDSQLFNQVNEIFNKKEKNFSPTNWNDIKPTQKQLTKFKEEVGEEGFNQAKSDYQSRLNDRLKEVMAKDEFKELSDEDKIKALNGVDTTIQDEIFDEYGFTYKTDEADTEKNKMLKDIAK